MFWLTDYILNILHIEQRGSVAHFVAGLLAIKLFLLALITFYSIFGRLRRRWTRRQNPQAEAYYRNKILEYLFAESQDIQDALILELRQRAQGKMQQGFLRRLVIAQLKVLRGVEFDRLVLLYRDLGFFENDLALLRSAFWWKRLAAVLRLEKLHLDEIASELKPLTNDKNDLVALAAMRALGDLHYAGIASVVLAALGRRAPDRRDVFIEILLKLGSEHIHEVLTYLQTCADPRLASICIFVLGELRALPAVDALIGLLKSSDDEVVAGAVQALGKIGDPKATRPLRRMIRHPSPLVRARTLGSLMLLGDHSWVADLKGMSKDPSVEVRRAVFEILHPEPH